MDMPRPRKGSQRAPEQRDRLGVKAARVRECAEPVPGLPVVRVRRQRLTIETFGPDPVPRPVERLGRGRETSRGRPVAHATAASRRAEGSLVRRAVIVRLARQPMRGIGGELARASPAAPTTGGSGVTMLTGASDVMTMTPSGTCGSSTQHHDARLTKAERLWEGSRGRVEKAGQGLCPWTPAKAEPLQSVS